MTNSEENGSIQIQSDNITLWELEKIVPNPKNPNDHPDDQVDHLCKQFEYQGFRSPLIVSKRTGFLIVGHGRLLAAKKLRIEKLPVMVQEFKDEAQEYAFMVADNATADWSSLDLGKINIDMLELGPEFDIDLLGIKDFVLDLADVVGFDKTPPEEKKKEYKIEVKFPNDMEMMDIHDDLLSRGYLVKTL